MQIRACVAFQLRLLLFLRPTPRFRRLLYRIKPFERMFHFHVMTTTEAPSRSRLLRRAFHFNPGWRGRSGWHDDAV